MANDASNMFDAECRVECMLWIPGLGGESQSDVYRDDFLNYLPSHEGAQLYAKLPALAKYRDEEEEIEAEEIAELLMFVPGFLVQAATPVHHYQGAGGVMFSGWGHYYTEWLYAATEADIAKVCVEWAEQYHAEDRVKAGLAALGEEAEAAS